MTDVERAEARGTGHARAGMEPETAAVNGTRSRYSPTAAVKALEKRVEECEAARDGLRLTVDALHKDLHKRLMAVEQALKPAGGDAQDALLEAFKALLAAFVGQPRYIPQGPSAPRPTDAHWLSAVTGEESK